ncbi:MAG: ABC transporter permease [Kangiellaceae bacterium]|nr:ABC transporter permease [Kangiellaceae bacterium]
MILRLIQIELIKTKRSLALLMMVLSPLVVVLVNILIFIKSDGGMIADRGWSLYWLQNYSMWAYFMMPLYIALITALLNGIDHNSCGWRYMMSLPLKQSHLFIAKFILAWIYIQGANIILFISVLMTIVTFDLFGYVGQDLLSFSTSISLLYASVASLAIIAIQHIVSWRWKNIVVPLGLGVIATMSIVQFSSSEYWALDPWAYILMSTNASDSVNQHRAIFYSISLSIVLMSLGSLWFGKREIHC